MPYLVHFQVLYKKISPAGLASCTMLVLIGLVATGCGNKGLGMKVEINETDTPQATSPPTAQKTLGSLKLTSSGSADDLNAIAEACQSLDIPDGELRFTELAIRNRTMEHPSRGSAEIDGFCIWTETGEDPEAFTLRVRTHSIPLDTDTGPQLEYLRQEAVRGMLEELLDEL